MSTFIRPLRNHRFRNTIAYIVVFFASALSLSGCDDSSNDSGNTLVSSFTVLSGKITNWNSGGRYYANFGLSYPDSFISFGKSAIDTNGNFSIVLKTPPDSLLIPVLPVNTMYCTVNFSLSNPEAKKKEAGIYLYDSTGFCGTVFYANYFSVHSGKEFTESYLYFNSTFRLIGTEVCTYSSQTFRSVYDYNALKGWNRIYCSSDTCRTGDSPEGGEWICHIWEKGYKK